MTAETVLVTGGSGFVGSHVIIAALQQGYNVRITVRSPKRIDSVRKVLVNRGASEEQAASVQVFAADLTSDEGWLDAVAGCDYVLHVASPYPSTVPKDEAIVDSAKSLKQYGFVKT
jgi:dihydroflavonol-4-reductase